MAIHREPEYCPVCGKPLQAIHKDMGKNFVGDTFAGYKPCDCSGQQPVKEEDEILTIGEQFAAQHHKKYPDATEDYLIGLRDGYIARSFEFREGQTIEDQIQKQYAEKGNRLGEIVGAMKDWEGQQSAGVRWDKATKELPIGWYLGKYQYRNQWVKGSFYFNGNNFINGPLSDIVGIDYMLILFDESLAPSKEQGEEGRMGLEKENERLKRLAGNLLAETNKLKAEIEKLKDVPREANNP